MMCYATAPKVESALSVSTGIDEPFCFSTPTVAREEIEETQNSQSRPANAPEAGAYLADSPELQEVREAWPRLSKADRAAVLAIVRRGSTHGG